MFVDNQPRCLPGATNLMPVFQTELKNEQIPEGGVVFVAACSILFPQSPQR